MEVLRQVLSAPRFDDAVFTREQARTIASLKEAMTRPDAIAGKAFWAALYPNHPYGRQATPESVAAISPADLRAFYQRWYNARNASVTIVGDLPRAEAEKLAQTLTAGLPQGDVPVLPAAPTEPAKTVKKIAHPAAQAHIQITPPPTPW